MAAGFALVVLAAAAIGLAAARTTPGRYVDNLAYDLRIALTAPPSAAPIVIVKLDDDSLDEMRAASPCHCLSPIDKPWLGRLVADLSQRGARVVALDVLLDTWRDPAEVQAFAQTLHGVTTPVIAVAAPTRRPGIDYALAPGVRYADARALVSDDYDGVLRGYDPQPGGRPALAAAVAEALGARPAPGILALRYRSPAPALEGVDRGAPGPTFSAADVRVLPAAFFRGKAILIGRVTRSAHTDADVLREDMHMTPLRFLPGHRDGTPGVEVHAAAVAQMLQGDRLRRASLPLAGLITLLAAAGGAALGRSAQRWWRALAVVAVALVVSGAATLGAAFAGWMLPVTAPSASFVSALIFMGRVVARHLREESAFYASTLARYLAPQVIDRIAEGDGGLTLSAEEREITVLVTDLEGFSGVVRTTPLATFSELMNDYFDGLIEILWKHEATIDKMTGDGMIAFFGAPLKQPDHAQRALACAREMDAFAEGYRQAHAEVFGRTRIGISSGVGLVGNFGGERRFNYTAYGAVMVEAARLEAASKDRDSRVLFSRATLEAAGDPPAAFVGALALKGIEQPIEAFTLA